MIKDGKNEFNWVGVDINPLLEFTEFILKREEDLIKEVLKREEDLIKDVVDTINDVLTQHKCNVQILQEPVDSCLWEYQCFFSLVEK